MELGGEATNRKLLQNVSQAHKHTQWEPVYSSPPWRANIEVMASNHNIFIHIQKTRWSVELWHNLNSLTTEGVHEPQSWWCIQILLRHTFGYNQHAKNETKFLGFQNNKIAKSI